MLIGLTGFPQVGKGEVSKILEANYGFEILDTKKLLREITGNICNLNPDLLKKQETKQSRYKNLEVREIMGEVGLLLEDMFGEDFLLQRALEGVDKSRNLVVDGLRRNQALAFDGLVLEIVSTRVGKNKYSFDAYDKSKVSYTINNSGSLLDLRIAVDKFMENSK